MKESSGTYSDLGGAAPRKGGNHQSVFTGEKAQQVATPDEKKITAKHPEC